jgi:hypothetical protein
MRRLGYYRLAAPNGTLYSWVSEVGSLLPAERVKKKLYHDPGLMTWQGQQGLSRFALPIAFSA